MLFLSNNSMHRQLNLPTVLLMTSHQTVPHSLSRFQFVARSHSCSFGHQQMPHIWTFHWNCHCLEDLNAVLGMNGIPWCMHDSDLLWQTEDNIVLKCVLFTFFFNRSNNVTYIIASHWSSNFIIPITSLDIAQSLSPL